MSVSTIIAKNSLICNLKPHKFRAIYPFHRSIRISNNTYQFHFFQRMQMVYIAIILTLAFFSCDFSTASNYSESERMDGDMPPAYTSLSDSIPDYYQRDMAFGGFEDGGAMYCGPVTASNALMRLYQKGHSELLTPTGDTKRDQYNLIKQLGSSDYFRTGSKGTNPGRIASGLKKFFEDRDLDAKIDYLGWRYVRGEFRTGRTVPELKLLKQGLHTHDAVLINLGWYRYDAEKNEYTRTGGHWVTLVGYGHDGEKENPSALIFHDSETRTRFNDYIETEQIRDGTLKGTISGLPRNANRFVKYRLSSTRAGIIDGALLIDLPEPEVENRVAQK